LVIEALVVALQTQVYNNMLNMVDRLACCRIAKVELIPQFSHFHTQLFAGYNLSYLIATAGKP
jgi:hypothetical protein